MSEEEEHHNDGHHDEQTMSEEPHTHHHHQRDDGEGEGASSSSTSLTHDIFKFSITTRNKNLYEHLSRLCKHQIQCMINELHRQQQEKQHKKPSTEEEEEAGGGEHHHHKKDEHKHNVTERILFGFNVTGVDVETVLFPTIGIKIWHVMGAAAAVMLFMFIVMASTMKCRIPRTRKQIEMDKKVQEVAKAYADELLRKMENEMEQGAGGEDEEGGAGGAEGEDEADTVKNADDNAKIPIDRFKTAVTKAMAHQK